MSKRKLEKNSSSNSKTVTFSLRDEYNENKEENINEDKDAEEDLVNCDDEFVIGLDILIEKANYDLKRSNEFLSRVKEYKKLCQMTLKELHNSKMSYMKVVTYAYKMSIINGDPEIHYASAIGDAVRITTDTTAITATDSSAVDNAATTNL